MVLWGFWVLAALINPAQVNAAQADFSRSGPGPLVLGLVVVAAAMVIVAAIGLPVLRPAAAPGVRAFARRSRTAPRPRLIDPDAAGRPRPRAPSAGPAAA